MYDYGWSDEKTAVAERPISEKEREAKLRQAAEKEDARLRHRARIKQKMAESLIAESRLEEIMATIDKLEARKESLAADHVETCKPIQAELELLRKHRVDRILDGDDDDADADRRIELQDKIADANTKLEKQIADCDASLTPLYREKLVVAKQVDTTLRGDLMHTCSAENRIRLRVARSRCEFLHGRLRSVRDALIGRPSDALLPHVLADAEQMLFEAEQMSSEAVAACVDE